MTAAINTTDDLIRLLSENTEFCQAVRRLVLTDELLQLPERFAVFAGRMDDFIGEQRGFNRKVDDFIGEQRGFNRKVDDFIGEQRGFNRKVDDFIGEQRGFNEEWRAFNRWVQDEIGELKGNPARGVIYVHVYEIAAHLDLTLQRILSRHELGELIGPQGRHADVSSVDRAGFIRADLVIIGADANGDARNAVVEACCTADARDTPACLPQRRAPGAAHRPQNPRDDRQRPQRPGRAGGDRPRRRRLVRPRSGRADAQVAWRDRHRQSEAIVALSSAPRVAATRSAQPGSR